MPSAVPPESGIPIVNLFANEPDDSAKYQRAATELYEAFRDVGFAYITNHGVPEDEITDAFTWSRKFFYLPQAVKESAPHPPEGWHHRGYSGVGLEKVSQNIYDEDGLATQRNVPDCKESFDIGKEDDAELPNIWPADEALPGFRAFFNSFYETCYGVELRLLRMIAAGMGLDENYFLEYHRDKQNQIRLLHYPPVEDARLDKGEIDCIGAHSDFGTITLLFQDEVGGLEVEDLHVKGKFNPAPYIPGTIVVNIGDFLMRWSNDELRSTLHHVRTPPMDEVDAKTKVRMTKERFSIPYFIAADRDKMIDCVPGCYGAEKPKKYEPINCAQYLDMRLNATY